METTSGHKVEQIGQRSHADPAVRFLQSLTASRGRARPCPGASAPGPGRGTPRGRPGPPTAEPWSGDPALVIDPGPSPWEALPGNPRPCITKLGRAGNRDNMRGRGRTPGRAGKSLKSGAACSRGSRSQEPPSAVRASGCGPSGAWGRPWQGWNNPLRQPPRLVWLMKLAPHRRGFVLVRHAEKAPIREPLGLRALHVP